MWRTSMTATTDNFFDSINGALTLEQALQALSLEEKAVARPRPPLQPTISPVRLSPRRATSKPTRRRARPMVPNPSRKTSRPRTTPWSWPGTASTPSTSAAWTRHASSATRRAGDAKRQLADLQAKAREEEGQAPDKTDNLSPSFTATLPKRHPLAHAGLRRSA